MRRKKLEGLFKKHGIPSLLKGNDELASRGQSCFTNNLGETASGKDSSDEIRVFKKVRFNPDTEVRHYVVSGKRRGRLRRSMMKKPVGELSVVTVGTTVRITRSQAKKVAEGEATKVIASGVGNGMENGVNRDKLGPPAVLLCSDNVENSDTELGRREFSSSEEENNQSGDEGGKGLVISTTNLTRRSSRKRSSAKDEQRVLSSNAASEENKIAYGDAKPRVFNGNPCGVVLETEVIDSPTKVLLLREPTNGLRSILRQNSIGQKKGITNEVHAEKGADLRKDLRRSKRNLGKSADSEVLLTEEAMKVESVSTRSNTKYVTEVREFQEELGYVVQAEQPLNSQGRNTSIPKLYMLQNDNTENEGPQVRMVETRKLSHYPNLDDKGSELEVSREPCKVNNSISLSSEVPSKSMLNPSLIDETLKRDKETGRTTPR